MKNNDINNNKLLSLQYNYLLYLILLTNGVVSYTCRVRLGFLN